MTCAACGKDPGFPPSIMAHPGVCMECCIRATLWAAQQSLARLTSLGAPPIHVRNREPYPVEDLVVCDEFIHKQMVPLADFFSGSYPVWYGWALREAFMAGMKHATETHWNGLEGCKGELRSKPQGGTPDSSVATGSAG